MSEQLFKFRSTRNVDWNRVPKVIGRVVEKGSHPLDGEEREYIVLDDGPALHRVYRAADLGDAFKVAAIGDMVSIEFVESITLKKTGRKLNRFNVAVWSEPKAE